MDMELPTSKVELDCQRKGFEFSIGIDEAGRGPLCGSVVAAACVRKDLTREIPSGDVRLIRDSKSLSEKQREKAFDIVREYFYVGVGESDAGTIDRINILQATFLAMKKAISSLRQDLAQKSQISNLNFQKESVLLVDGNQTLNLSFEQKAIPKGDKKVQCIAAASIIAKVTRDREILEMHRLYPQYGFDKHKGYGTRMHMNALQKYGPLAIHRRSFGPVKRILRELRQYGADV